MDFVVNKFTNLWFLFTINSEVKLNASPLQ